MRRSIALFVERPSSENLLMDLIDSENRVRSVAAGKTNFRETCSAEAGAITAIPDGEQAGGLESSGRSSSSHWSCT